MFHCKAIIHTYHPECIPDGYLTRGDVEPVLVGAQGDGQATLVMLAQGAYGQFRIPYIESWVICAEPHFVMVLVAYHSTRRYRRGRGTYALTAKGQFYRYYRRSEQGWQPISWRCIKREERTRLAALCRQTAPAWARSPGAKGRSGRGASALHHETAK